MRYTTAKHAIWSLAAAALFLLMSAVVIPLGPSGQVLAQAPTLTEHLKSELRSNNAIRRHLALIDVVGFANCPDRCAMVLGSMQNQRLEMDKRVDLTDLTPELLENYRRGPEDRQRLLALSALIGIGDEDALATLVDEGAKQSANVNRETQRNLAAFYLNKYPELARRAKWTGEISLVDVEKAKRVRVKKVKKAEAKKRG